jgi:hypothetical protein
LACSVSTQFRAATVRKWTHEKHAIGSQAWPGFIVPSTKIDNHNINIIALRERKRKNEHRTVQTAGHFIVEMDGGLVVWEVAVLPSLVLA